MSAQDAIIRRLTTVPLVLLVFISTGMAQAKFEVLHTFSTNGDGRGPWGRLLGDKSGNLYGTTISGGAYNYGSVFELSPSGSSWTETVLYSFQGSSTNLQGPQSGLVMDPAGNLFGTTFWGGAKNVGTIFELSPPVVSGGAWGETTLFEFRGYSGNGAGGLLRRPNGVLLGTTLWGENVYQLTPPAVSGGNWGERVLFTFNDGSNGFEPLYQGGALVSDRSGNLYGTTAFGGAYGNGEVFELSPPSTRGGPWTETVLYSFDAYPTDGVGSDGALVIDTAGNLYGTTVVGGLYGAGTVFEISPPTAQGQPWTETLLHSFSGGNDGSAPYAGMVMDRAGNLFGVTYSGGNGPCTSNFSGCGTVFEISSSGSGSWTESVLHSFQGKPDGQFPYGGLMIDNTGRLYGVTSEGGSYNYGTVFRVVP